METKKTIVGTKLVDTTDSNTEDTWAPIIINGKGKTVTIKNPKYKGPIVESIEDMKPFQPTENMPSATLEYAEKFKRDYYSRFFSKNFKNLVFLSGAGSSYGVGGPLMSTLWKSCEETIGNDHMQALCDKVMHDSKDKNLEKLLSQIDIYNKYLDSNLELSTKDGKKKLSVIKEEFFMVIKKLCTLNVPKDYFPHKEFLTKVLQRKQTSPRIKLFTLNYDLMFEYAANSANAVIIDGFSFTYPRTFSGRYFDYDIVKRGGSKLQEEDNFIERVVHLHKMHGSLNWKKLDNGEVVIEEGCESPMMVYPRDAKYEDSYSQPFFEMMARFQTNLRKSDDTLLICTGYSFNDKHVNAAIIEALNQNPGFRLAVIDPSVMWEDGNSKMLLKLKEQAYVRDNILMVGETFDDFSKYYPEIQTYKDNSNQTKFELNE